MHYPIPLFIALTLMGAGCSWSKSVSMNAPDKTADTQTQETDTQLVFASSTRSEETELYTIRVDYPVAQGGNAALSGSVNSAVDEYVATTTAAFKDYLKDAEQWYSGAKYDLAVVYAVPQNDTDRVSVVFSGYEFTGGAHGMHIYQTLVFDARTGQRLAMSDVLKTDGYLKKVADACRAKLQTMEGIKDMSDDDWLKQGTEPTADNYRYWYATKDTLHVIFPPYQVAAYAAGDFDVAIPFSELAEGTKK